MYNPVTPRGGTAGSIHTARIPRPDLSSVKPSAQHSEGERGREREREKDGEGERQKRESERQRQYKIKGMWIQILNNTTMMIEMTDLQAYERIENKREKEREIRGGELIMCSPNHRYSITYTHTKHMH